MCPLTAVLLPSFRINQSSHGNVRARVCVEADADAVVATIPWRQRVLLNTCQPTPPPAPKDPCEWKVYWGGYNESNIPGGSRGQSAWYLHGLHQRT